MLFTLLFTGGGSGSKDGEPSDAAELIQQQFANGTFAWTAANVEVLKANPGPALDTSSLNRTTLVLGETGAEVQDWCKPNV